MGIPISLQIRKIIFEKFNDTENRFNNDQIFSNLQESDEFDKSLTIDDMEVHFKEISKTGLCRIIAEDFTTIWFKLFDPLGQLHCNSCGNDIHLSKSEDQICPNPDCKSKI